MVHPPLKYALTKNHGHVQPGDRCRDRCSIKLYPNWDGPRAEATRAPAADARGGI